jgi:hypothetical protein
MPAKVELLEERPSAASERENWRRFTGVIGFPHGTTCERLQSV